MGLTNEMSEWSANCAIALDKWLLCAGGSCFFAGGWILKGLVGVKHVAFASG